MKNFLFSMLAIPLFIALLIPSGVQAEFSTKWKTSYSPYEFKRFDANFQSLNSTFAVQTITQNNSTTIEADLGVTCNNGSTTSETKYYRYFNLPGNFGISNGFDVISVGFGIEGFTTISSTGYPITINIYSATVGTYPNGVTSTIAGTAVYTASGSETLQLIELPLTASIPAGSAMIMEMIFPSDGITLAWPGFNSLGETAPSYIVSDPCGISTPTSLPSLGFTDAPVFTVTGDAIEGGNPCGAVDVPYTQDFESAVVPDMPECTTVENAGSGNNWTTSNTADGQFTGTFLSYMYNTSNAANSWFYTQGINLTGGTNYKITYEYGSKATSAFPENLRVAYGTDKTYSAMTTVLAEHVGILTGATKLTNTVEFSPTASGVYYFGFNAFSPADQWYLYVDNIQIELSDDEPGPGNCEQDFYSAADPISGAGFSGGNIVANDIVVPAGTSFTIQTIKFETVALSGQPTTFNLEIFEDNGSGGVGSSTGMVYDFNSSNMSFVDNGLLFGYPQYTVTLQVPDAELIAEGSDKRYWLGIKSEYSTTNNFTYWVTYLYATNPDSNPTWQFLLSTGTWSQYDSSGANESYMKVEGVCEDIEEPGDDCLWTVTVWDTENSNFGDEVSWTLTNANGDILLSGGNYTLDYTDTQTVTAAGPLTFFIEAEGTFNDNTPSYEVSNGTDTLVSGELFGGDSATYDDLNCSGEEPGEDCSQGIPSFATVPDGYNIEASNLFRNAEDFTVDPEILFTMNKITIDVNQQEVPNFAEIRIHEDNGGQPGVVIQTITMPPSSSETVGSAFGDPIYHLTFDLATPIEFEEGTYWIDPKMSTPSSQTVWWAATDQASDGAAPQGSLDNGTTWSANTAGMNLIFTVSGECTDDEDPEPGDDCDQGDDSNNFENGFNITAGGQYRNADDFFVSAGNTLNIQQIELNVFASAHIDSMNFIFYEDNGGSPGSTVVETLNNVPAVSVAVGSNFGFMIYRVFVDVDLSFTEGHYWMQPEANADVAYWEVSSIGTLGEPMNLSDGGGAWTPDADGSQGVFKLHCEPVTPPDEECLFDIVTNVEPITRVVLANVDNASSVTSTDALEDFTNIVANLTQGQSYEIAVEGTTDGDWTDYVTAWIDWNHDGTYDDPGEMYEIGSITNSTGTDGQQAIWTITIPSDAMIGMTTMRIIKNWNTSPTDPCGVYSYGQGEDYSVNLISLGVNDLDATGFAYYPNPVKDVLNISSEKPVKTVEIYNLAGQRITKNAKVTNGQLDMSVLPTGTYVFRVTMEGNKVETFKVVKK